MKTKVIKFLNKYWPALIGIFILFTVVMYYVVTNSGVQVFHYDMIEQGIHFIQHGYNLIREPGITLWDWNNFMGSSIFSHGFYFLFSPFWLIFAALPDRIYIPYVFLYVNILKHTLLFVFSCVYLSKIRKDNISVFAGACIITFSGFALGYYNYSHFIDVMLFVPLILYFIEIYLAENKYTGLVFTVTIIAIINPYLTILFTGYIFPYTLFRYISLKDKFILKNAIIDALKFSFLYLIGIGISAVFLYPNLSLLLASPRIENSVNLLDTISKNDLFRYLTSFLQPIVDRNNFNPLINKFIVPSYGHSGGAAVYSLIITPFLVPHLLYVRTNMKHKIGLFVFYGFYVIFSFFPNLYFFIQGNNDTRWMMSFIFLNAYTVSYLLDNKEKIKKIPTIFISILISLSLVGSYFYSRRMGLQNEEIYYSIAKRNVIILGFTLWVYTSLFFSKLKLFKLLLVLLITFESYFAIYNIFFNPVSSISMSAEEIPSYQLTNDTVIREIESIDSSEYRIDVLENSGFNNPMSKEYMGFTFYHSVYNYEIDDFIQNNISSAGGWVVTGNAGKWQFKEMFASKYWFDLTGGKNVPFGYSKLANLLYGKQQVDVYRNDYPIPLMYAMDKSLSYDSWKQLNSLDKMRSLMSQVILYNDQNVDPIYPSKLIELGSFSTQLEKTFESNQSNAIVYVTLPRSEEVKMSFFLNDVLVRDFYSYEPQYSSVYVTEEFNKVVIEVTNLYGVPEEEFINNAFLEFPKTYFDEWYQNMTDSFVSNIKLLNNSFSGEFISMKSQWIVTSIAYDKNWKVYINGSEVKVEKVNGGFIGFEVPSGNLEIYGVFFPIELKIGVGISIISILIFFLIRNKHWI